ncbi:hypothetical protein BpHYR1_019115 [Brachionus plicatilis]|uniref:Uncharacterized protein n=1 Tax=Brachionus plicatilis TaxID=10195 RepID=A0A3M7SD96_BRAPC|nr:hypothetical protein BpHYR1_019115 [Brachionus plicatilis]
MVRNLGQLMPRSDLLARLVPFYQQLKYLLSFKFYHSVLFINKLTNYITDLAMYTQVFNSRFWAATITNWNDKKFMGWDFKNKVLYFSDIFSFYEIQLKIEIWLCFRMSIKPENIFDKNDMSLNSDNYVSFICMQKRFAFEQLRTLDLKKVSYLLAHIHFVQKGRRCMFELTFITIGL